MKLAVFFLASIVHAEVVLTFDVGIYQKSSAKPGDPLVIDPSFSPFNTTLQVTLSDPECTVQSFPGVEYCRWFDAEVGFQKSYLEALGITIPDGRGIASFAQAYIQPNPALSGLAFEFTSAVVSKIGTAGHFTTVALYSTTPPSIFPPTDSVVLLLGFPSFPWTLVYMQDYIFQEDIGYNYTGEIRSVGVRVVPEPASAGLVLLAILAMRHRRS